MKPRKLKLMISSQCTTKYPFNNAGVSTLSEIRAKIKSAIQSEQFLGEEVIKVWINEDATQSAGKTWWDECIDQAEKCDLMLVINSGSAGNQLNGTGIGICHAEFAAALAKSPKKIYVLTLTDSGKVKTKNKRDTNFQNYLRDAKVLEGRNFNGENELIERAKIEVSRMMRRVALEGVAVVKESVPNTGEALIWSGMDFAERSHAMIQACLSG